LYSYTIFDAGVDHLNYVLKWDEKRALVRNCGGR